MPFFRQWIRMSQPVYFDREHIKTLKARKLFGVFLRLSPGLCCCPVIAP